MTRKIEATSSDPKDWTVSILKNFVVLTNPILLDTKTNLSSSKIPDDKRCSDQFQALIDLFKYIATLDGTSDLDDDDKTKIHRLLYRANTFNYTPADGGSVKFQEKTESVIQKIYTSDYPEAPWKV